MFPAPMGKRPVALRSGPHPSGSGGQRSLTTRFITYPNVDGLKPGEQTHFYSFYHDLGRS